MRSVHVVDQRDRTTPSSCYGWHCAVHRSRQRIARRPHRTQTASHDRDQLREYRDVCCSRALAAWRHTTACDVAWPPSHCDSDTRHVSTPREAAAKAAATPPKPPPATTTWHWIAASEEVAADGGCLSFVAPVLGMWWSKRMIERAQSSEMAVCEVDGIVD